MRLSALLVALAAAAGCSTTPSTQVVTGTITGSSALAVSAVANGQTITAARVRTDGSFTLSLPAGKQYELHVLTASGVEQVLDARSAALAFRVCEATAPFDLGGIAHGHAPHGTGMGSGSGGCDQPPPCDPSTGMNCPPPCDPMTGSGCMPPPCDPTTDPSCMMCDAAGNCYPPCDPTTQPDCPTPPPPCMDPTDPNTCQDPCMGDPMQCGCDPSGSAGSCWPPPPPCDANGNCSGMVPDHPPGDFGC